MQEHCTLTQTKHRPLSQALNHCTKNPNVAFSGRRNEAAFVRKEREARRTKGA